MAKPVIKFLIGSTRPNRFGPKVAAWLQQLAKQRDDALFELIDLHQVDLPFLDEPEPALYQRYQNEHTKAWSQAIAEADGLVFITAEYNHSYPAALKNAIDFLAHEWYYKPLGLVSYGSAQGGARAVEHLRGVAAQLKMYDLQEQVAIPNYWQQLTEAGEFEPTEGQVAAAQAQLDSLVFWAEHMKAARAKLATGK